VRFIQIANISRLPLYVRIRCGYFRAIPHFQTRYAARPGNWLAHPGDIRLVIPPYALVSPYDGSEYGRVLVPRSLQSNMRTRGSPLSPILGAAPE
jgi:hypothetical protein